MDNGNITDLNNLKFYSDSGVEIYAEKQYVITWRLSSVDGKYCLAAPTGYIMSDVNYIEKYQTYVIDPNTIYIGFIGNPEISIPDFIDRTNEDEVSGFIRDVLCGKYITTKKYKKKVLPSVILTITVNGQDYSANVPTEKFFGNTFSYTTKKIAYGETDNDEDAFIHLVVLDSCSTINEYASEALNAPSVPYLYKLFCGTVPVETSERPYYFHHAFNKVKVPTNSSVIVRGEKLPELSDIEQQYLSAEEQRYIKLLSSALAQYFPFVCYSGSLLQPKTSTGFIAANTIIVLEEVSKHDQNTNGSLSSSIVKSYERPYINDSTAWSLIFKCEEESELKIIETDDNYSIKQVTDNQFVLSDTFLSDKNDGKVTPISFAIGVLADQEGCYQNYLGLYLKDIRQDVNQMFFLGVISVKTEIEGEDERYRALMNNFGIPDPKTYPNIFAEEDYEEQLCDWTIVNKKCKELMLIYDKIFPFAGSYKGLVNALKFLGYDDIIIKEWYKIFDKNNQERDVAFDSVDLQNGKLKSLLEHYNVDYDNRRYSKLNWISLVYHLNETSQGDYLEYETPAWNIDKTGKNDIVTYSPQYFDIPYADPIYTYRNTEIIAKLYSIKHWLETYIIGVMGRIIDITGEGIVYVPHKTQIYPTGGYLADFIKEAPLTPIVNKISEFKKSSANIDLTISEFDNVTFGDYNNFTFDMFTRNDILIPEEKKILISLDIDNKTYDIFNEFDVLSVSNTLETCIWPDELEYQLNISPDSGTLYYYTEQTPDKNQVIVHDNVISLLNNKTNTVKFKTLPEIRIETGNIRRLKGSWEDNIIWGIKELVDQEGNTVYKLSSKAVYDNTSDVSDNGHIVLVPGEHATFEFSCANKWNAPMFIMSGYKFDFSNVNLEGMSEDDVKEFYDMHDYQRFIVEIIKGQLFLNNHNEAVSAQIDFGQLFNSEYFEHQIKLTYSYKSERLPVTYYKDSQLLKTNINTLLNKRDSIKITSKELDDFMVNANGLDIYKGAGKTLWTKKIIEEFVNNPEFREYYADILLNKYKIDARNSFYQEICELFKNYLISNKIVSVHVNNIGDYDIIVNGYDRYNNIFNNKSFQTISINTPSPNIDIIVNQENSSNLSDFCSRNESGKLLDKVELDLMKNELTVVPEFPGYFTVYGMMTDTNAYNKASWWNYSYSSASPKQGDSIVFMNCRYQVKDIEISETQITCCLYDYNKETKHIFNQYGKYSLYAYDPHIMSHALIADNLTLDSITETNELSEYDAILRMSSYKRITNISVDAKHTSFFIINTQEHEITIDNIKNNYSTTSCTVTLPDTYSKVFAKDDVIRISYYATDFDYRQIVIDFSQEKNPILHNAMFDSLYPCLFVEYTDGSVLERQLKKLDLNKNEEIPNIEMFARCFLICYSYNKNFWTVYDLTKYVKLLNNNTLTHELLNTLITNINNDDCILVEYIEKSHAVEFDKYNDILYAKFNDNDNVITNNLYNSVAYRITDVYEYQKQDRKLGLVTYYSYTLNGLLDTEFINRKLNDETHTIKVTIGYPYKDLVFYKTTAIDNSSDSVINYGSNYSMLLTSVKYDADTLMLDNYIDTNFANFILDYNPDNMPYMWCYEPTEMFKENVQLYKYHNTPVSINSGMSVLLSPVMNNQFTEDSLYEWSIYAYSYDFLNGINRYDNKDLLEKLLRVNNKVFCIKPSKPGPCSITLKVIDPYGNIAECEANGILLVK